MTSNERTPAWGDTKCNVCGEKSTYSVSNGRRNYTGLCQLHLVAARQAAGVPRPLWNAQ